MIPHVRWAAPYGPVLVKRSWHLFYPFFTFLTFLRRELRFSCRLFRLWRRRRGRLAQTEPFRARVEEALDGYDLRRLQRRVPHLEDEHGAVTLAPIPDLVLEAVIEEKREVDAVEKVAWDYAALVRRAEKLLIYGQVEPEDD